MSIRQCVNVAALIVTGCCGKESTITRRSLLASLCGPALGLLMHRTVTRPVVYATTCFLHVSLAGFLSWSIQCGFFRYEI